MKIIAALVLLTVLVGCTSSSMTSDDASYPTAEKWWK